jgi:hypothetical protein
MNAAKKAMLSSRLHRRNVPISGVWNMGCVPGQSGWMKNHPDLSTKT